MLDSHPNAARFQGVLTKLGVLSDRAPSGSSGRRVIFTREAAKVALPTLIGMALDWSPTWDRHDVRRKVGVITDAGITDDDLWVSGIIWQRDFPEVVERIAKSGDLAASANELGMSYEITDCVLLDRRARIWTVTKATFTGACILQRSKAAYAGTWIELVWLKNLPKLVPN